MNEVEQKARELKSFMAPAGITTDAAIKRVLESQVKYIDSYNLTDSGKQRFKDAAALIISELDDTGG